MFLKTIYLEIFAIRCRRGRLVKIFVLWVCYGKSSSGADAAYDQWGLPKKNSKIEREKYFRFLINPH